MDPFHGHYPAHNVALHTSPNLQHHHYQFDMNCKAVHVGDSTFSTDSANSASPPYIEVSHSQPNVHHAAANAPHHPTPPKPNVEVLNDFNQPEFKLDYSIKHPEALEKPLREHLQKVQRPPQETQNVKMETTATVEFERDKNGKCKVNKLTFANDLKLQKEDHEALVQQLDERLPNSTGTDGRWTIGLSCLLIVSAVGNQLALREFFFPSFHPKPLFDEVV